MTLAEDVLAAARARGLMIATAESCTGGLVAAAITDIAGSSAVLDRGFVTYSNTAKTEMLGVRPETLDTYGAVSEQVASEMAVGCRDRSRADVCVAITGVAGPGGSEHKPEGRVCFAVSGPGGTQAQTVEFGAPGRDKVRDAARDHALRLLISAFDQTPGAP